MTTWLASLTFSRTQMKWSDSNVRVYCAPSKMSFMPRTHGQWEETDLEGDGRGLDTNC